MGIGGESLVFRYRVDNFSRALKIIPYEDHVIGAQNWQHLQEVSQDDELRSNDLEHENIINFKRILFDHVDFGRHSFLAIVFDMEIYDSTLWEYFKRYKKTLRIVPMTERFKMYQKLWNGLKHLQDNNVFHLDFKLSNILVKTDSNGRWNEVDLVITDFGIGGKDLSVLGNCGTNGWASPEQLIGHPHKNSDNYGFGKLLVFIFCEWSTAWDVLFNPV